MILCLLTVIFVLIPINFGGYYWYTILGAVWFFLCSVSYPGLLVFCNMKYGLKLSSSVYGYLLLATAITTINIGFIKCIAPVIGYSGIFYVIGGIFVLGLVFNLQLSEKPYKYSRKTTLTSLI